ncbi:HAD hydrolase family protein, partial [Anaerotignum lactatifermentans]
MYRLIASDMDETFLGAGHAVPAANIAALERMRALGILFIPSSGRPYPSIMGSLSGIVEPVFGILVVLASGWIQPFMPWLLSFAAGAMVYVVVEELIPEAHLGEHSNVGTFGVIAGFVIMMV